MNKRPFSDPKLIRKYQESFESLDSAPLNKSVTAAQHNAPFVGLIETILENPAIQVQLLESGKKIDFAGLVKALYPEEAIELRIQAIETWIDEQKAKPGSKDPSRSALHAHLDEVLNRFPEDPTEEGCAYNSNYYRSGASSKIHKFFRELMK